MHEGLKGAETPSPEQLRELLSYCPETGHLRWRSDRSYKSKAGDIAGTLDQYGYIRIYTQRVFRLGHRVAWAIHFGRWPAEQIDHVNGIGSDNRLVNLREASARDNTANRNTVPGATGYKGVFKMPSGRFAVRMRIANKQKQLGTYDTAELAAVAYDRALIATHGEFARPNFPPEVIA
jgi:hypothetical protein